MAFDPNKPDPSVGSGTTAWDDAKANLNALFEQAIFNGNAPIGWVGSITRNGTTGVIEEAIVNNGTVYYKAVMTRGTSGVNNGKVVTVDYYKKIGAGSYTLLHTTAITRNATTGRLEGWT